MFSAFTEMVVCESPVDTQQFLFMFHFRSFVFLRLLGNTYNAARLANICKAPIKFDLKIHKKKTKKKTLRAVPFMYSKKVSEVLNNSNYDTYMRIGACHKYQLSPG